MRPEVHILGGVALITAGAASLFAMNIWTVPSLGDVSSAVPALPSPQISAEAVASQQPAEPPPVVEKEASVTVSAPEPPKKTSTTYVPDDTELPSIRFEPDIKVSNPDVMKQVKPIASYLQQNFVMKVVLIGHGDDASNAAEYVNFGRSRAASVLRLLVDYGVSASRIGIELPKVHDERVETNGVPSGSVEVRIEPRFVVQKKGENDGP